VCDPQGQEVAGPLLVDDDPFSFLSGDTPQITALANGAYAVTWENGDPALTSQFDQIRSATFQFSVPQPPSLDVIQGPTEVSSIGAFFPVIGALANGDYAIAYDFTTTDFNIQDEIVARVFDPSGQPVGGSTLTQQFGFDQPYLSVTGLSGGGFALAWDSNDITDLFQSGIRTATFSSDGSQLSAPLGLAFVNPPNELEPTFTLLADGGYAVSWTTYLTSNNSQVVTQTFGANATGPTQISAAPATGATGGIIAHAASPGGGYALAWSQVADVFGPGDDSQIYFASFDPQGSEIGAPIDISQSITSDMGFFTPQMTALSNGDYALVWHSTTDATFDTFLQREWTAIYDGNGNQIVAPELVGQIIGMPVITSLAGSDYAVAWQGDGGDVYTAVYGPHGQQVSAPLDISHASGTQPQLVTLSNGDYAVAWVNDTSGISTAVFSSQGEQIIAPAVVSGAINGQDSFTSREPALTALANGEYVVTWLSPNANYPTDPNPNELWISIYRVSDNSNAPPSPPLITGFTPDTGIAGDRITEAQSLVVSGTSEPGTVQVQISDGAGLTRTVTPDSAGNWSVPFSNLALGTYDFTAIAVNDLGNASAASAAFEIDVVPPPAPIITGFTPDTGVAGDHITEAQSLVVSGTSEPGIAQVKVSDGAGLTRVVTPDAAGNWSVPFSNLALGTYDFTAIAVNGLGNASAASAPFEIKIEINAPPVISSGASVVAALGLASQIKNFLPGQNGISISDADAGSANETIRVELKEHDGVATLSANKIVAGGGGMIDGGGTNDLVITGTLAQVNADLSTVTVSGSQSDHTDAIDIQASDGRGGTDASELGLVIDAPALATVPGTQSVQLGAPLSIPIAISDADANPTAIYIVALRDTNGAAFSITGGPQTTTFNFNGSFEVLAPLAELNNDLATLQYQSGTSGRDTISVAPVDDFQLGFVQQFVVDVNAPLSISPKSLPGFPLTTLPIYQVGVATPMSGFALVDRPIAVISDADAASETIRVELKERDSAAVFSFDTNPAVAPLFGGLPAGAITGQGTNDLVITGNLDTVNLDLAAVTILASRSDSGDLIDIQASDGRGSADATEFSATIDAPAVTSVPGDQVAQIGLTLPIPKISVSDVDADTLLHNETYSVELKATLGFLAITGGSHTAILFNGSHDVTITAPLDELNTDLASLLYLANSPVSDTITIQTKDGIGYGDMQQIAVSVNVPPVITGVEDFATMELGEIAFIKGLFGNGGISLSDADSAGETFRVELKELDGAATLFADTNSGGGGTIQGSGTSDLVITGSLAEVNGDLSSVVISGIRSDGGDQILIDVSDGRGGFDSSGFDLQIDAPAVATVPGNQIAQLGATLSIHGIGVSDADADTTPYRVELSDQVGSLTVTGGLHTFISGSGTHDVTITAPLGELNTDLASVGYLTSTLASDTITVHAQDNFGFGSSGQIAVTINAPPHATAPSNATVTQSVRTAIAGIGVTDSDGSQENFSVTLAASNGGILSATTSGGGGKISGAGTSHLTISGTLGQVDADLATLTYFNTRSGSGTIDMLTNDGRGGSDDHQIAVTINPPIQLPPPPKLIKGYISGATVFGDDNGNGQLDPNEFTATTDAKGGFALAGGSGPLIAFGGVDISTGLPFLGEFTAPADSIVVTPLTTLLNLLEQQGVGDAEARLLGALNLAPGLDLFTLDPIAAAQGGDLTGAAAEVAAAKVYDTVALIAATLSGIGATFKTAVNDSFAAIAAAIAGAGINLADPAALTALIDGVAQSEGLTLPLGLANEVATILAASNAALDHVELADQTGASLLADTAAIEKDVQGGASQAFGAAGGDPTKVAAFAFNFTGADGESFDATAGTPALVLSGSSGNDVLTGSAVISNIIDGKAGNDTMSGGLKDDTFVFEFGVSQHTVNDTVHHHDFVSLAGVTSVTVGGATYNKPALNASINAWKTWDSALTAYANGQLDNTGGDDFTAFTNTNPANPKNVGTIKLIDGYFHNYDTVQPVIVTDLSGSGFDVITNFGNQALTVVSAIGNDTMQFNGLSNDQTALNYWGNWLTSTTRNGTTTIDFHDVAHNVADVAAISLIGVTTNVSTLVADNIVRFGSPSA